MKLILPILLCLAISPFSFGSHWGAILVPEITLKHPEAQVTVKVDTKSAKLAAIEVIIGENTINLSKEELAGIDRVDIRSVRLVTSFSQGNYESRSKLTDSLIIAFEFGPIKYHADEETLRIIPVYSVARFEFESSKYLRRNTAKPAGNYKNMWQLFEKEVGGKEREDGTSEGVTDPC